MDKERRLAFEALVLGGLWMILRAVLGRTDTHHPTNWRSNALSYMDANGVQGDDAKAYRRENGFPSLHP